MDGKTKALTEAKAQLDNSLNALRVHTINYNEAMREFTAADLWARYLEGTERELLSRMIVRLNDAQDRCLSIKEVIAELKAEHAKYADKK